MKIWIGFLSKGIALFIHVLPKFLRNGIGDFLGFLWFDVFRIRRDLVLENLRRAFPDWTPERRLQVGRESLKNLGRDLVEYADLPFLTKEAVEEKLQIEGLEHFQEALRKEKGVCLLTLHLGNGDFAVAGLSLLGYPMYLISKEFKLKWLNDLWFGMRARLGTHFIPPRNSSYSVLKALKKRGVIVFVLDQFTGPPIGMRTHFFGHETGTGIGLATIAERAGCPVVPVYTYRREDGSHVIHFDPEIPFRKVSSRDESLVQTTQAYNDKLEEYVKLHPQQWMWIHRRWKKFKY